MLIRKPIYPDKDALVCNNRNIHEYCPYVIKDNTNVIDKRWWDTLTPYCQNLIRTRIANFVLDDVSIPHEFQFDNNEKFLTNMYKSYIDSFDYHVWYPLIEQLNDTPKNITMIFIPVELKVIFVELYEQQKSWKSYVDNQVVKKFHDELSSCMKEIEYFVRMSSTSGKNEESVNIFASADDIIQHISSVKLFVDQEYRRLNKDSYLILMPWNYAIEAKYEFRIFVVDGILTSVSQQNRYDLYNYTAEELEIIVNALNNISFLKSCGYATYVGDVYIDMETEVCKLIELNPFGAHSGAGAALFNWKTDYDILHGKNDSQPEFRYLSVINF